MEDIRLSFSDDYIVQTVYEDTDCTTFSYAIGYRVTDSCSSGYYESERLHGYFYYVARLDDDGSARIDFFSDSKCDSPYFFVINEYRIGDLATKYVPKNDNCVMDFTSNVFPGYYQWYTSERDDNEMSDEVFTSERDDNAMSDEVFACIIVACIFLILIVVAVIITYQERKCREEPRDNSLIVTVTLDTAMDANEILHYEQPGESSEDGVQYATLVENLFSD
ncbi:TKL protein kinase [Phytophthora palmivora]|uniref:TKL protein kinase n=1 Tax=Phytophthora palmivora TaxID=4796 RepID=A0A2P4YKA7_9STRA|nr:TKL protein kinase [Phytophthora palmivora]